MIIVGLAVGWVMLAGKCGHMMMDQRQSEIVITIQATPPPTSPVLY